MHVFVSRVIAKRRNGFYLNGVCVGLKEAFDLEKFSDAELVAEQEPRIKAASLAILGGDLEVTAHVLSAMSWSAGSVGRALLAGFLFKAARGKGIVAADTSQLQKGLNSSGSGYGVGRGLSICNSPVTLGLVVNVLR